MAKSDLGNHDVDTSHLEPLEANVDQYFKDLLEASSLGTPAARQVREQTDGSIVEYVRRRLMTHTENQQPAARLQPPRHRNARPAPRIPHRRIRLHGDQPAQLLYDAEIPELDDSVKVDLLDFPGIDDPVKQFAAIDFGTSATTVWYPEDHPDEASYDQVNVGMIEEFSVGDPALLDHLASDRPPLQEIFEQTLKDIRKTQERLNEPFRVLVVGNLKAGKSTLLNSLFSYELLPGETSGESLKDARESLARLNEPVRISMLGATGSGKTTALFGLYRDFFSPVPEYDNARDLPECPVCAFSLPEFGTCPICGFLASVINESGMIPSVWGRDYATALVLRDLRHLSCLAAYRLEQVRPWHLLGETAALRVRDLTAGGPAGWDLAQLTGTARIWSLPGSSAEGRSLHLPDLQAICSQVSPAAGRWRIELAARSALWHGLSDARSPRLLVARYTAWPWHADQPGNTRPLLLRTALGPDPGAVLSTGRPAPGLAGRLRRDPRNPGMLAVLRRLSRGRRTRRGRPWLHLLQDGVSPYARQTGPFTESASRVSVKRPLIVPQRMEMPQASDRVKPAARAYGGGLWQRDLLAAFRAAYGKDQRAVNFLRSLEPAEYESFAAVAVRRSFACGARLMPEGEPADHVIVIVSGWTRVTAGSGGAERVLAERGPGQLVGERAALRRNVRSATVTALTEVTALVMPAEDFASFVAAHPRVLDVVENQIYDRLTEDPEGYPGDWRGKFPQHAASDALAVRQAQVLAGENCTVVLTDVVGFGARDRNDRHRRIIRDEHGQMMRAALGALWDGCFVEDRVGGLLIVAPPQIPTSKIMEGIQQELPNRLRMHNSTYAKPCQFQLRVAVNVGPVTTDELGIPGEAVIRTSRLVEEPSLEAAMEETGHGLGIIVSEFAYVVAVGNADAGGYESVEVDLGESGSSAWMRIMDTAPPSDLRSGTERRMASSLALAENGEPVSHGVNRSVAGQERCSRYGQ